jgi:hypothetical protein
MWKLDDHVFGNLSENPSAPKPSVFSGQIPAKNVPPADNIAARLKSLKELKDSGILNGEEYESRRKALVSKL